MSNPTEALLDKMRKDAAFAREIVARSKAGELAVAAQQAGFQLEIAEADRLALRFSQAPNPLSENDLAEVTGAGEGDYDSWLDHNFEGA